MKGWKVVEPHKIVEQEITENSSESALSKVRITKSLLTLADVLHYDGTIDAQDLVLGSSGIGIVSETDNNLLNIEKGTQVYVDSKKNCGECYLCKNGNKSKCLEVLTAGEDYDGFLRDFVSVQTENTHILPENINDKEALFIDHISLAVKIIDRLNVSKGDYVTIVGANNLAVILAQLLIYYQAVPIIVTNDEEDLHIAVESGIYYALGVNDNWVKEIAIITSKRMTDKVVYISDCDIQISKAFSVAAMGGTVVYTGVLNKSNSISFTSAVKKQLNIICINNGYGNTEASINLISNKALNLDNLKINTVSYKDIPSTLKSMNEDFKTKNKIYETIVNML